MYHLNIFQLNTDRGGTEWAGGGGGGGGAFKNQKPTKKCHKINRISSLTRPNNSLKNATNVGVFFTLILNHLTLVLTG